MSLIDNLNESYHLKRNNKERLKEMSVISKENSQKMMMTLKGKSKKAVHFNKTKQ